MAMFIMWYILPALICFGCSLGVIFNKKFRDSLGVKSWSAPVVITLGGLIPGLNMLVWLAVLLVGLDEIDIE